MGWVHRGDAPASGFARSVSLLLAPLVVKIESDFFVVDCIRAEAVGRNLDLGNPAKGIHDELAEFIVLPVFVKVATGETKAAASVGTLDRPHDGFFPALCLLDVGIGTARKDIGPLADLVARVLATSTGVKRTPPISLGPSALKPSVKRMLKYHSSRMLNGLTPLLIGCSGSVSNSASQIGLQDHLCS